MLDFSSQFSPSPPARPLPNTKQEKMLKTVNLHAKSDFEKGDLGRVSGHVVTKTEAESGLALVIALQDVKAGTNGWFEKAE